MGVFGNAAEETSQTVLSNMEKGSKEELYNSLLCSSRYTRWVTIPWNRGPSSSVLYYEKPNYIDPRRRLL
jgi:hypothetical protein